MDQRVLLFTGILSIVSSRVYGQTGAVRGALVTRYMRDQCPA
jgi:hypothetical protein